MRKIIAQLFCYFRGHDYGPVVYVSPAVLTFCRRCGREIQDRTFDDLESMTDEDHDNLELIEGVE